MSVGASGKLQAVHFYVAACLLAPEAEAFLVTTMTWIEARNRQREVGIEVGDRIEGLYIADDADLLDKGFVVRSESTAQITQGALYHCGARGTPSSAKVGHFDVPTPF